MDSINTLLLRLLRTELCRISPETCFTADELCTLRSEEVLEKLYTLSAQQDLSHIAGAALHKLGIPQDSAAARAFRKAQRGAFYRYEQMTHELSALYTFFGDCKVSYIPLKGSFIRQYYPSPDMRTSCDIDILVSPADLATLTEALTEQLHYQKCKAGAHDVHFISPGGVHLELHFTLIDAHDYPEISAILEKVWENTVPDEVHPCQYHMTLPFAYFYHIAHMVKHFLYGGCGIRTFMDLWILHHGCPKFDVSETTQLLHDGGLLPFEKIVCNMSEAWFSGTTLPAEHVALAEQVEAYIFAGGIYGNVENRVLLHRVENTGKTEYLRSRLFLPYEHMKYDYPLLQKHKALLPLCQVHRWFRLLSGDTARRVLRELKINHSVTENNRRELLHMLKQLGLKE